MAQMLMIGEEERGTVYQGRRGLENGERVAAGVESKLERGLGDECVWFGESGLLDPPQQHGLLRS